MGKLLDVWWAEDREKVLAMLDSATLEEINEQDQENKETLLHVVSYLDDYEVVKKIIDKGGRVDIVDKDKLTPLDIALRKASKPVIDCLLTKTTFRTDWHRAAYEGDIKTIRQLLEQYKMLDAAGSGYFDSKSAAPHKIAAAQDHFELAKLLFESDGFPVTEIRLTLECIFHKVEDLEKTPNKTADYLARYIDIEHAIPMLNALPQHPAFIKNVEWLIKKLLLRVFADPAELQEFLLESKPKERIMVVNNKIARVAETDSYQELKEKVFTVLKDAVVANDVAKVQQWMNIIGEYGDVFYDSDSKFSLVHYAALYGRLEVLKILKDKKMDMAKLDKERNWPLDWAVMSGNRQCFEFLSDTVPIVKRNKFFPYQTPIQKAIYEKDLKKLRELSKQLEGRTKQCNVVLAVRTQDIEIIKNFFFWYKNTALSSAESRAIGNALESANHIRCSDAILEFLISKAPPEITEVAKQKYRRLEAAIESVLSPVVDTKLPQENGAQKLEHGKSEDKKKKKRRQQKRKTPERYHELAVENIKAKQFDRANGFFAKATAGYELQGEKLKAAISFANAISARHVLFKEDGVSPYPADTIKDCEAVLQRYRQVLEISLSTDNVEFVKNQIANLQDILFDLQWYGDYCDSHSSFWQSRQVKNDAQPQIDGMYPEMFPSQPTSCNVFK